MYSVILTINKHISIKICDIMGRQCGVTLYIHYIYVHIYILYMVYSNSNKKLINIRMYSYNMYIYPIIMLSHIIKSNNINIIIIV